MFGAFAFVIELERGRTIDHNALSTALVCVLLAGALALRRLSPGAALAVAWTGAGTQMAFARPPGFVDLAILAVLYATAAHGTRLVFWLGFASAIAGAIVITVYLFRGPFQPGYDPLSLIGPAAAVLVAALFGLLLAWTAGALVRTARRAREHRGAQRRAEADAALEQERLRIARDMHDVVAHSLAVVIAQADGARYAAAADPAATAAALETISTTARTALADVRTLLTRLRRSDADGPQPALADLDALFVQLRTAGLDLRVEPSAAFAGTVSPAVQLAAYRILQEALTNALRHGDAGPVHVRLAGDADRIELSVRNRLVAARALHGVGGPRLAPSDEDSGAGHGVTGMRERASAVGGTLTAGPRGGSYTVTASLPRGAGS